MGLYRMALGLLPRWFRERYGASLLEAHERELGERRGLVSRSAWRFRALADLGRTALRLRLDPPAEAGPHGRNGAPHSEAGPHDHASGSGLSEAIAPGTTMTMTTTGRMTMDGWLYDLRMAFRSLRRSPAFTTVAVLTLALALGANAAIFGVLNGVVLAPLPYDDEDELVMVWSRWNAFPKTWVSEAEFQSYTRSSRTLEDLAAWGGTSATFTSPENPERVSAAGVTVSLFETLGVEPVLGRTFSREEVETEADVILIGHRLWQRRFGGDPGVVGQIVEVGGTPQRILGVTPEGFRLPTDYAETDETELFFPFHIDVSQDPVMPQNGGGHGLYLVGRAAQGATADDVQADLSSIVARHAADGVYPPEMGFSVRVIPIQEDVLGTARAALWVLLGAVGLVLLIACGNVANLLLARGRTRAREMAMRAAVGAPRGRVVRQVLLEGTILAVSGAALGLILATVGVEAILALDPGSVPRADAVRLDGAVLLFTAAAAGLTVLAFGLVPALQAASRSDLADLLRQGTRETGREGRRAQSLLVAGQTALAVMLLVGAGLMLRTFASLTAIDPGFRTDEVLTMRVSLPSATYPDVATSTVFYDQVLADVRSLPAVRQAAFVRSLPLASQIGDWGVTVEGYEAAPNESTPGDWQIVTAGYFEALGIPVVRGRAFDSSDDETSDALVINEAMARRYWGERDPLGTRVVAMGDTTVVVGVVADVTHNGITAEVKAKFYRLQRQLPDQVVGTQRNMTLVAWTDGDPYRILEPARAALRRADPTLAVSEVQTLADVAARTVGQPKLVMTLLGGFAALALLLAVIGVYGVLAYAVSRRTREIGVRMALGAERGSVVRMVVRQGMLPAGLGLLLGLGAALLLGRALESLLYGVAPRDPGTFAGVGVVFLAVTLTAAWLPARRAARTDPVVALKVE